MADDQDRDLGAQAYSEGIDARRRGEPLTSNPWGNGDYIGRRWTDGWHECHHYYADWRPERWGPAVPLPPLRQGKTRGKLKAGSCA